MVGRWRRGEGECEWRDVRGDVSQSYACSTAACLALWAALASTATKSLSTIPYVPQEERELYFKELGHRTQRTHDTTHR